MEININKKNVLAAVILSSSFLFAEVTSSLTDNNVVTTTSEPIGAVIMWSKTETPLGWLDMNGQDISGYTELVEIYGTTLPDLRNNFIRGYGGNSGSLGKFQDQSMKSHNHGISFSGNALPSHSHVVSVYNGSTESHGNKSNSAANDQRANYYVSSVSAGTPSGNIEVSNFGESEVRPTNIAFKYIVKAE